MNCIFWGNENNFAYRSTLLYCDFDGGFEGEGNIDDDPLFVNPDEGDYHLSEDSPCIDTGDPEADLDPDGTRADMGAFHFHQRDIEVEPETIAFEGVQTGTIDSSSVIIRNVGLTTLTLHPPDIDLDDSPFTHSWDAEGDGELEPESEYFLWIYFSPEEQDEYRATLFITSDDPDEDTVRVELTGTALGVDDEDTALPLEFCITSIYPNPFNNSVRIGFSIKNDAEVSLAIYDLSGRLVEEIGRGQLTSGRYTKVWNAKNISAGSYLIRLETAERSITRKVALIK